jgi:hypothetical protein
MSGAKLPFLKNGPHSPGIGLELDRNWDSLWAILFLIRNENMRPYFVEVSVFDSPRLHSGASLIVLAAQMPLASLGAIWAPPAPAKEPI